MRASFCLSLLLGAAAIASAIPVAEPIDGVSAEEKRQILDLGPLPSAEEFDQEMWDRVHANYRNTLYGSGAMWRREVNDQE